MLYVGGLIEEPSLKGALHRSLVHSLVLNRTHALKFLAHVEQVLPQLLLLPHLHIINMHRVLAEVEVM